MHTFLGGSGAHDGAGGVKGEVVLLRLPSPHPCQKIDILIFEFSCLFCIIFIY